MAKRVSLTQAMKLDDCIFRLECGTLCALGIPLQNSELVVLQNSRLTSLYLLARDLNEPLDGCA